MSVFSVFFVKCLFWHVVDCLLSCWLRLISSPLFCWVDQPCACFCCLPRVCNKYGIHPARRFHRVYGEHIARKTGNADITFKQVRCVGFFLVSCKTRFCSTRFVNYCAPIRQMVHQPADQKLAFNVYFVSKKVYLSSCSILESWLSRSFQLTEFFCDEFEIYWLACTYRCYNYYCFH